VLSAYAVNEGRQKMPDFKACFHVGHAPNGIGGFASPLGLAGQIALKVLEYRSVIMKSGKKDTRMSSNLNPDVEARLIALVQSNGVSVEFLRHVVEEKTGHSKAQRPNPAQWGTEFDA